jgi:hypothetical protein
MPGVLSLGSEAYMPRTSAAKSATVGIPTDTFGFLMDTAQASKLNIPSMVLGSMFSVYPRPSFSSRLASVLRFSVDNKKLSHYNTIRA